MYKDKEKAKQYRLNWYYKNKTHAIDKIRQRRQELREWMQQYKSTLVCSCCDEDEPCCLDFHHADGTKEISISTAIQNGWSIKRILKEIEKCIILCANCHRKLHFAHTHGVTET